MRSFHHINAKSLAEAGSAMAAGDATLIAGGTEVLGLLKDNILPAYPATLINLKSIPGLDYIVRDQSGALRIGALTRLSDIAASPIVNRDYTALAQAASRVATPHVREMGTIGGNIAQLHRCWYFRKPENRFHCIRKAGDRCFAMMGDNRYHSIFGSVDKCIAVNPGDTAPALIALNAKIVTTARTVDAEHFWDVKVPGNTVLAPGEIIREIQLPALPSGAKSAFIKFAIRKTIDFPIVNCAVMVGAGSPRICLNAVAPKPYRAAKAEAAIAGKTINETVAEVAGAAAVEDARPLQASRYKVQIAKTLVKRALLATV